MKCARALALCLLCFCSGIDAVVQGTFTAVSSFTIPKSPSGMFFYADQGLLYILCGTATNGDHYIYAYSTDGVQKCFITIPEAASMSRVDGFYIVGSDAYIVDSQGPIYASTKLGGSVYKVTWTNPCGCDSTGTCTSSTATWSPTVTQTWTLDAADASINDGGGADDYFRNSGIVVQGQYFYAVNGVHPNPTLTCCYPKSIVKVLMTDGSIAQKWSYTASTLAHDVDMEGMTCGPDGCATHMYVGDEYNKIYQMNLGTTDAATAIEQEWDISSAVGSVPDDKGIESIAYAPTTGYFYAGIQETATIHVVSLTGVSGTTTTAGPTTTAAPTTAGPTTTAAPTTTGPTTTAAPAPASMGIAINPSFLSFVLCAFYFAF